MVFTHKIAISGANGFVAKNLRHYLSKKNIQTVCIARKDFKILKNETKIISKNYSEKKILPKLEECSTFIHLVGIGKQNIENDYESTNLKLTRELLQMCKKVGIKKFVFLSGLGVSSKSTTSYFISKFKAEREIINSKLNYTIFRPSFIMGKNDYLTKKLKKQISRGSIIIPGNGKFFLQPISINDVCEIIFQSITLSGYSKQILDLVGPQIITYEKLISLLNFKKTKQITLERAYHNAIHDPNFIFGIDDLNILVGNFLGDFKKLKKLSKKEFVPLSRILKTSGLS